MLKHPSYKNTHLPRIIDTRPLSTPTPMNENGLARNKLSAIHHRQLATLQDSVYIFYNLGPFRRLHVYIRCAFFNQVPQVE
jgi:hypothetical protein